ncbi:proton-conducting transporter membrane subunit [uncultured Pseudokineococcus sp.]|uniref:proton-conducting transporter transmembrane domain-containing protein n=1 Tax=uncultured Pseudokineococcus sp. TaxID=1642928 RepID=UPI0026398A23|nr:proton-conducting transporter membrane subunit [uncultured Pseudokineococcus sp.]
MSGEVLVVLPVVLPLLVAGALVLVRGATRGGSPALARWAGVVTTGAVGVVAGALLATTLGGEVPAVRVGGWAPGIAIALAADVFSSAVLLAVSLVVLAGLVHARGTGEDRAPALVPLVLVMAAGVHGALLTADLFNLFVFVELMLVPSYVLLLLGRRRTKRRLAAARLYVSVNLLASTVFLVGVGLVYAATGTVALGELAQGEPTPARQAAVWLLLLSMGAKCAAVPLHGWLSRSYAVAGPAVVAIFSGLLTKTGVVVLVRLDALLVPEGSAVPAVVLVVGLVTAVVGVLLAVGEHDVTAVLVAHMVSQVGYLLTGLGLATTAGTAAVVVFLVQYVLVKAALLMVAGALETRYGTGRLDDLGSLAHREPVLAAAFALSAAALVGLPPTSGFVGKLGLVTAAGEDGRWVTAAVLVAVSLLTLVSMLKLWDRVFWGPAEAAPALAMAPSGSGAADDADPGRTAGVTPQAPAGRAGAGRPDAGPDAGAGSGPGPGSARAPGADGSGSDAAGSDVAGGRGGHRERVALVGPPLVLGALALVAGVGGEALLVVGAAAAQGLADPSAWVAAVTGGAP